MTSVFLLTVSESSSSARYSSGVWGQQSYGEAVGKQMGDLESGYDQGTLVLLTAWLWDPWCTCLKDLPGPQSLTSAMKKWVSDLQHPVATLNLSTCDQKWGRDNMFLLQVVTVSMHLCPWPRLPLSPTISSLFLPHFSLLVPVPSLPPWTSTNPRVLQQGHIGRRTMGIWPTSPISPLLN